MAPTAKMRIIVTENILLEGEHTEKGTVATVDADLARMLISCNRAEEATEEALEKLERAKRSAIERGLPED